MAEAVSSVEIGVAGACGCITLGGSGRKAVLDAKGLAALSEALKRWVRDPEIYAVVARSHDRGAFAWRPDKFPEVDAKIAWLTAAHQYVWQLERFTKPHVALIAGGVSGAGVAVTRFGTHRVAAENAQFSFPEVVAGGTLDLGTAHVLARLPNGLGTLLALTGRAIGADDACWLGIVTHVLPEAAFDDIGLALAGAEPVDPLLDHLATVPQATDLQRHADLISRCCSGGSVTEIIDRLRSVRGADAGFAREVAAEMDRLPADYADFALAMLDRAKAGCRAALIDNFRVGVRRARGAEMSQATALLAPLGPDELVLPDLNTVPPPLG